MAKTRLVKPVKRVHSKWVIECLNDYIMNHWDPDGWNCEYVGGETFTDDQVGGNLLIVVKYEIEIVAVIYDRDPYEIVLFNEDYLGEIRKMLLKLPHVEVLINVLG